MMSATWEMKNLWHFLFFIALLLVIQPQLFLERGEVSMGCLEMLPTGTR
jgi:hypothetical protein